MKWHKIKKLTKIKRTDWKWILQGILKNCWSETATTFVRCTNFLHICLRPANDCNTSLQYVFGRHWIGSSAKTKALRDWQIFRQLVCFLGQSHVYHNSGLVWNAQLSEVEFFLVSIFATPDRSNILVTLVSSTIPSTLSYKAQRKIWSIKGYWRNSCLSSLSHKV